MPPVNFPAGVWNIYMYGFPNQALGNGWPPPNFVPTIQLNLYQYGDVQHAPQLAGTAQFLGVGGLQATPTQSFALENVTFNPGTGAIRFRITGAATAIGVTEEDPGSNFRFTFEGTYTGTPSTISAAFTGGEAWVPSEWIVSLVADSGASGSGGGGEDDSNATWTGSAGGG